MSTHEDTSPSTSLDLSRRAVAGPGWRWLPGMLDTCGWRCLGAGDEHRPWVWADRKGAVIRAAAVSPALLPDLADRATLGCIEHGLLPAAWAGWVIEVKIMEGWASVRLLDAHGVATRSFAGSELAPCLVAALEAAPG